MLNYTKVCKTLLFIKLFFSINMPEKTSTASESSLGMMEGLRSYIPNKGWEELSPEKKKIQQTDQKRMIFLQMSMSLFQTPKLKVWKKNRI